MNSINRRRKKRGIFKYIIISLILLFVVLNYLKIQPFHSIVLNSSSQVLSFKSIILSPFNGIFGYFESKNKLIKELEKTKQENSSLKIEIISSAIIKSQYADLLEQKSEKEEDVRIAKILFKPPFSSFDNLIITGDFNDNDLNKFVFYENIVLGEIEKIENNNAIVKLLSATDKTTTGQLKDGAQFEVFGRGTGRYEMILPKDVNLEKGDPVAFPFEKPVLIGVISEVFSTEDDLFNRVLFNIPIDFSDINFVRIEDPKNILIE